MDTRTRSHPLWCRGSEIQIFPVITGFPPESLVLHRFPHIVWLIFFVSRELKLLKILVLSDGDGDVLMDPLMVDWFNLIRKKQMFVRKESELVYL